MSQLHKDAMRMLCPVALGPNHDADMELEGRHLDEIQDDAADLLTEMFPDTCTGDGLLEDWERLLGLPDLCCGYAATVQGRINAVVAKWAEKRKINTASLVEVAGRLGYTITVTKYTRRRYGAAVFGGLYIGKSWANTITVNVPAEGSSVEDGLDDLIKDEAGEGITAEGGLAGAAALECTMLRLRPAHVIVIFNYTE